jgi:hypothetical protein
MTATLERLDEPTRIVLPGVVEFADPSIVLISGGGVMADGGQA